MSSHRRALTLTAVTVLALAGCSAAADGPAPIGSGAPVIVPQGPGTAGRTASPGERLGQTGTPAQADVRFAESMIPHHRQALEMTSLVADRTTNPQIRRIADQITLAQGPEIKLLSSWLAEQGRPAPADHAHGPTSYGMAGASELTALAAAKGADFDRMFLQLMIRHHTGALKMAQEELADGQDQRMRLMARDVYAGQSIEIERMKATAR